MKVNSPPDFLDDDAKEIYTRTYKGMPKPLTATDADFLAIYAQSLSDYKRLSLQIMRDGDQTTDHNGALRKHPLGIPQAKAFDMMTKAANALKLDKKNREGANSSQKTKAKTASLRKAPRTKTN
jgi:P27 family predicted phage terminase small subunit